MSRDHHNRCVDKAFEKVFSCNPCMRSIDAKAAVQNVAPRTARLLYDIATKMAEFPCD